MFRGNALILDRPRNLLEAFILGWTLVLTNLKCRNDGTHLIITKES